MFVELRMRKHNRNRGDCEKNEVCINVTTVQQRVSIHL